MTKKIKNTLIILLSFVLIFSFVGCSKSESEEVAGGKEYANPVPPDYIGSVVISSYNAEYTAKDPYSNDENIDNDNDLFLFTQSYALQYPSVDVQLDATLNYNDYFETLEERILSGDIGDVVLISSDILPEYAEKGWLVDLSMDANGVIDYTDDDFGKLYPSEIYMDAAYQASTYNGRLYMCPVEYTNQVVILNIDLLEKAGIENPVPKDAWTWTQLLEYAQKLSESGVETPVLMNYNDYAIWGSFARGFGGNLYNEVDFAGSTTELNLTDPDVMEGICYFADNFLKAGLVDNKTTLDVKGEELSKYGIIVADHTDVVRWNEALSYDETNENYFDWEFAHFPGFELDDGTICNNIGVKTLGFAVLDKDAIYGTESDNEENSDEEETTSTIDIAKSLALYAMVSEAAVEYCGDMGLRVPVLKDVNQMKFWREYPVSGKNTAVFSLYSEYDYPAVLTSFLTWNASKEVKNEIKEVFEQYVNNNVQIETLIQNIQDAANAS